MRSNITLTTLAGLTLALCACSKTIESKGQDQTLVQVGDTKTQLGAIVHTKAPLPLDAEILPPSKLQPKGTERLADATQLWGLDFESLMDHLDAKSLSQYYEDGEFHEVFLSIDRHADSLPVRNSEKQKIVEALQQSAKALQVKFEGVDKISKDRAIEGINEHMPHYFPVESLKQLSELSESSLKTVLKFCFLEKHVRNRGFKMDRHYTTFADVCSKGEGDCSSFAAYYVVLASMTGHKDLQEALWTSSPRRHINLVLSVDGMKLVKNPTRFKEGSEDEKQSARFQTPQEALDNSTLWSLEGSMQPAWTIVSSEINDELQIDQWKISRQEASEQEKSKAHNRITYGKAVKISPKNLTNFGNYIFFGLDTDRDFSDEERRMLVERLKVMIDTDVLIFTEVSGFLDERYNLGKILDRFEKQEVRAYARAQVEAHPRRLKSVLESQFLRTGNQRDVHWKNMHKSLFAIGDHVGDDFVHDIVERLSPQAKESLAISAQYFVSPKRALHGLDADDYDSAFEHGEFLDEVRDFTRADETEQLKPSVQTIWRWIESLDRSLNYEAKIIFKLWDILERRGERVERD